MVTIMVTGVGAIIGYGLLRSLQASNSDLRLIGADIYDDAVGQAWCNYFEQAPYTASPDYLTWLQKTVKEHQVDLLIPGIEQDLHYFSDNREVITGYGCKIVLNNVRLINLSRDKWAMHQELKAVDDPARIPSFLSGDYNTFVETTGLPFLLKPRQGYASKGIVRVTCQENFEAHKASLGKILMVQPVVGTNDEEYTVAAFGDGLGNVCASITLQRRLAPDGSTAKARVRKIQSLDDTVSRLCKHFQPIGPTNFQFRRHDDEWKLLEINPRVSSASSLRRAFGFNEAEMSLAYFLEGKLPAQPTIRFGFAARFIEDYVIYDRDNF